MPMCRFVETIAGKLLEEKAFGPLAQMSEMDANCFRCGTTL